MFTMLAYISWFHIWIWRTNGTLSVLETIELEVDHVWVPHIQLAIQVFFLLHFSFSCITTLNFQSSSSCLLVFFCIHLILGCSRKSSDNCQLYIYRVSYFRICCWGNLLQVMIQVSSCLCSLEERNPGQIATATTAPVAFSEITSLVRLSTACIALAIILAMHSAVENHIKGEDKNATCRL